MTYSAADDRFHLTGDRPVDRPALAQAIASVVVARPVRDLLHQIGHRWAGIRRSRTGQ